MDHRLDELRKEQEFQAARASKIGTVTPTPERIFERYRRNPHPWIFPKEMLFRCFGSIHGKEVLDVGCGEGELTTQLAKLGARVTGIDISPELIEVARKRAVADDVQDRTELLAWDILERQLPEERFDLVSCSAVLHHVNIAAFLPALLASLKPGGKIVMIEPLGLSPLLRSLRRHAPVRTNASPGEHPLTRQEMALILSTVDDARVIYYELFSRLQVVTPIRIERAVAIFLGRLDRALLHLLPFLRRFAGEAVIVGTKGRKGGEMRSGLGGSSKSAGAGVS